MKAARSRFGCGSQILVVLRQESTAGIWFYLLLQMFLFLCSAQTAKPSCLKPYNLNLEIVFCRYLLFEPFKCGSRELDNLSTPKTSQMQMVLMSFCLKVVLLAVQVHQIQFVDQAQHLKQFDRSVHCRAVNIGITLAGALQQARCIQMSRCLLNGFDQSAALRGQADPPDLQLMQQFATIEQQRLQLRLSRNKLTRAIYD